MSQQLRAEGDGRMEIQTKGSAVVLNDYMGLKLLGWRLTGSVCLNDSDKKKGACVPTDVGVTAVIITILYEQYGEIGVYKCICTYTCLF